MSDTPKRTGYPGIGSHSHSGPMTMAESLEAGRRRKAEITARQQREAEANHAEILARLEREKFIGPPDLRGKG